MRKTKKRIAEVASAFASEIKRRFPESTPKIINESFDGFDVWVKVEAPQELEDEIGYATSELFGQFGHDTGILILGTFKAKEDAEAGTAARTRR